MVAKFNTAVRKALDNPAMRTRLDALGLIPAAPDRRSPEYLRSYIDSEIAKWAAPVKASGLNID
jgi:tripartite-type tricarboxylate transporter receptor subunit TctC